MELNESLKITYSPNECYQFGTRIEVYVLGKHFWSASRWWAHGNRCYILISIVLNFEIAGTILHTKILFTNGAIASNEGQLFGKLSLPNLLPKSKHLQHFKHFESIQTFSVFKLEFVDQQNEWLPLWSDPPVLGWVSFKNIFLFKYT